MPTSPLTGAATTSTGVRLTFVKGVAVKISAETGEAFTVQQLRMDRGAARIGEFSLTDKRFSRIDRFMADTLFDENFGGKHGNCHIALGASYTDTYAGDPAAMTGALKRQMGFNDSALHWDLVNTEEQNGHRPPEDGGTDRDLRKRPVPVLIWPRPAEVPFALAH